MKNLAATLLCLLAMQIVFNGCNSTYTSKKTGYYAIELPPHNYRLFDSLNFPYSFEYPVYANILQDSSYFDNNPENNYWVNIDYPAYNARIFLSYKRIGGTAIYKIPMPNGTYRDSAGINFFDRMVNDAYTLTSKNDVVASSIKDSLFTTQNNVSGVMFKVGGNAATALQFFVTDSTRHFLRGALYFNATPNADSLAPVLKFMQADVQHLLETFKWKPA